jgi:hypothetical protein
MSSASRSPRQQLRVKRSGPLVAAALAAALGTSLILGAGISGAAPVGSSKGGVLRFYSKQVSFTYTTAGGKQLTNPPNTATPGDVVQFTDLDYVGNHSHHAKSWTISDHGLCIFITPSEGNCYVQVAVDGSMILAQGPLNMSNSPSFTVVGGSGAYMGITGTVATHNLDPNSPTSPSDVVITMHR